MHNFILLTIRFTQYSTGYTKGIESVHPTEGPRTFHGTFAVKATTPINTSLKDGKQIIEYNSILQKHSQQQQNHEASNGLQKQSLFVALLDYYPQSFCKSGHPEQELQLQAGDVVNVIGDMNSDGYYHVQFNDRQGLVPAHFLEEVNIKNTTIKQRLRNQVTSL